MDIGTAKEICKEKKCHCFVCARINEDGEIKINRINFWGLTKKQVITLKKKYKLGTMKKDYYEGDVDLKVDNVKFNQIKKCKVVGYKEEEVPATTRKILIYDCNGIQKT